MFRKVFTFALVLFALGAALVPAERATVLAATTYVVTSNADLHDADTNDPACKSSNGSCTLRAAVEQAEALGSSATIELQPNTTYALTLSALQLQSEVVLLGGANVVVDGSGNPDTQPVLFVAQNKSATVQGLTIRGGKASGIFNRGTLTLARVTVAENSRSGDGGGIRNNGVLIMDESTVRDNDATDDGGGMMNSGSAFVYNSTMNGNEAAQYHGGAIYNDAQAKLELVNSTLSSNRAGDHGGGIFNHKQAEASLFSVTIALNKADQDNDGAGNGGGLYNNDGPLGMMHTIVAYNSLENGQIDTPNDCGGFFVSNGYNLVRVPGNCVIYGEDTNGFGLDPKLGPLADNGGVTKTHALLTGSSAIDLGEAGECPGPNNSSIVRDQRNYYRIVDGNNTGTVRCDIGAFEAGSAPIEPPACSAKPDEAELKNPTEGAVVSGVVRVKLNWDDVACADTYKVRVKRDSKDGASAGKKNGLTKSKYKTKVLDPGHTYYWRVLTCNQHGCSRTGWQSFILE